MVFNRDLGKNKHHYFVNTDDLKRMCNSINNINIIILTSCSLYILIDSLIYSSCSAIFHFDLLDAHRVMRVGREQLSFCNRHLIYKKVYFKNHNAVLNLNSNHNHICIYQCFKSVSKIVS